MFTSINPGETVIEAFWDPDSIDLSSWKAIMENDFGVFFDQTWCSVKFGWNNKPNSEFALILNKSFNIDIQDFDSLILSIMPPKNSYVFIEVETDIGLKKFTSPKHIIDKKKEFLVDIKGAKYINSITIKIKTEELGEGFGWLNFIGLQNNNKLKDYLAMYNNFSDKWEDYLICDNKVIDFKPFNDLVVNQEELDSLRKNKQTFQATKEKSKNLMPEKYINDYVNFWNDSRYNRERDHDKYILQHGPDIAIAGLVLKDKSLLRLGARYALSIAFCDNWDDGFICKTKGLSWEHRCFVQSLCCQEICFIISVAGNLFTQKALDFIYRKIAEQGLGSIIYNTWKHEYIFYMNQLTWFSHGRTLAYSTLEKYFKRVTDYLEIAKKEVDESISYCILEEGSCVEGMAYFQAIAKGALYTYYYYSKTKGNNFREITKGRLTNTNNFAEALMSTDKSKDFIKICDCVSANLDQDTLALMAFLCPDGIWPVVFKKAVERDGLNNYISAILFDNIKQTNYKKKTLVKLNQMGIVSYYNIVNDFELKLFIFGNKSGADHTHEDKGSFILEYGGEVFAEDFGSCDYSSPIAEQLKYCQRHNMLIPYGTSERPHPDKPIMADIIPKTDYLNNKLTISLDLTKGFEKYYKKWERIFTLTEPNVLEIEDSYELIKGEGAVFVWTTDKSIQIKENIIYLNGLYNKIKIEAPMDCNVSTDELPLFGGGEQKRILIHNKQNKSKIKIKIIL